MKKQPTDKWWTKLKEEVINTDLYSRSGTEVGVSKGTIKLKEVDGDYFPIKTTKKEVPKIAFEANPDRYVNYPKLNKFVFGKLPKNWLVGEYQKIFIGYSKNEAIRRNASSGGIISGAQLYLLEENKVEGVVTLRMNQNRPFLTEPIIAKTRQEIVQSAQSKYTVAPVNQILSSLPGKYKSILYTGLPHQIVAIRKLQMLAHPSVKPINYIFGLFYGETLAFSAIKSLLRSHGVDDVNEIQSLAFREGEWPGNLKIRLKNGQIISIRKLHANYLIPSHITPFSLYQVDFMSELADVSVGDAWAPIYEQKGKGWSVVIARNIKGLQLIEEMRKKQIVSLKEISIDELVNMHSHGLDLKKRGAFIRIAKRKARGLPVPEYGYKPINIPIRRWLFEGILGILFKIFQANITIRILEIIPIKATGWFFIQIRNSWKAITKSTKKGGLNNLRFKIIK